MTSQGKKFIAALGVLATAFSIQTSGTNAAVVTHGFLSSDDTSGVIVDTNSNRQYTRVDAFNWSVAQTEASLASGGAYEGWSVATSDIMDGFVAALLGTSITSCNGAVAYGRYCGRVSDWNDADFGNSYTNRYDYLGFYNTNGGASIGLVEIRSNGQVREYERWAESNSLDYYSDINLVLYQDVVPIPVPAGGALLLTGLGGFVYMRRRKNAA